VPFLIYAVFAQLCFQPPNPTLQHLITIRVQHQFWKPEGNELVEECHFSGKMVQMVPGWPSERTLYPHLTCFTKPDFFMICVLYVHAWSWQ